MVTASELPVDTGASALEMARSIFGDWTQVVSASYTGDNRASGIFTDGDSVAPGVTPSDSGVIISTGRARDITNSWGQSNQRTGTSTNNNGVNNDSGFNGIAGANTYDASWLEISFVPTGDTMTLQFTFASEEYPEYAASQFQDAVGIWANGTSVPLGIGSGTVTPDTVNPNSNPNLFVDNGSDDFNTEMDGFTLTLSVDFPVVAGVVNTLRIGIADVGDSSYDSNILIAADSVQDTLIAHDDTATANLTGDTTIDVLDNDTLAPSQSGTMQITHINGMPVTPGVSVILGTGQVVTLNPDGTLTVTGDGDEEEITFTYEASDGVHSDIGIVTVDFVPCFVAGSLIDTPDGPRPVETLLPGDLVCTRDDGPQPLRWIGRRHVVGEGKLAPICVAENAFGDHGELWVSPMHRILIRDVVSELLFGESEVLVAAQHLVNGGTVRQVESASVEYVHLMFDSHQVLSSDGLESESFLPGPQATSMFEKEVLEELRAIFPDVDPTTGEGYSPAARRTLRRYEAELLVNAVPDLAA